MAPSVSAAVLTVLFWWCEETDHTADGVCNILWSSQQLGMTSDGTQLRGLEQMMAAHAPRTEAEYARDIGSIFNSYCTAAEGFTDRKKKDKSATICASRASNTLENLFRAPPKGWSKMGSGSADIPSADPRQLPATEMVEQRQADVAGASDDSHRGGGAAGRPTQREMNRNWWGRQRQARRRTELR
uniref:Uncharacterized protein n=1 Tax=Emiliania huxleyi TaxID=2903 RepID=A0A7S3SCF5_EMIHU